MVSLVIRLYNFMIYIAIMYTVKAISKISILTLIPISFFPTYSLYHALVTRYLNNMNHILTIFLARGPSNFVAKQITCQTSDQEDCSSNPPGGECIYSNVKKLGLSGIRTRISCVEARCPNHITNA